MVAKPKRFAKPLKSASALKRQVMLSRLENYKKTEERQVMMLVAPNI